MTGYTGYDSRLIAEYILYLSCKSKRPVTPMQLLKLVYICHGWMLALYGRPLVNELAEAWTYGPVLPSVYHSFKQYGGGFITMVPSHAPALDPEAVSVINQVWDAYSGYSGIQLSALTHQLGTPWDITRKSFSPGTVISNDLIKEHYRSLVQRR